MRILWLAALIPISLPVWAQLPQPFEVKMLDRSKVTAADLQGHPLILNFWATWCVPCRAEMPAFEAWLSDHRGGNVRMIAISMDDPARDGKVRKIASGFRFPVSMFHDAKLPRNWRPTGLPVTLVFDRNGVLRFDSRTAPPGLIDRAALDRIMTPLLD